ncbi:hypothetical protein [Halococcus salifodinae]|uniref:Uncharacterized protein n=1 Tax=Halococcus salifodinae DSM 8989 TaxID=1227456 RepID=M0NG24_9EURY|nr:hypothetical protein [Halococcus salifodinae]EMA55640.1 hypothetical protein C450_01247 [Halococcus salifodinae DSM 8989]
MADSGGERTKTRDVDDLLADVDDITVDDGDATTGSSTGTADRVDNRERASRGTDQGGSRLRDRAGQLFSLRTFVVALALTAVGMALGGFVPLVGGVLGFVGVFVATFVLGAVGDRSQYLEAGIASAAVAGGWSLFGNLTLVAVGAGLPLLAVNAGIGLLAGLVGHYFGRDLRDGLTREI